MEEFTISKEEEPVTEYWLSCPEGEGITISVPEPEEVPWQVQLSAELKFYKNKVEELEEELSNLRAAIRVGRDVQIRNLILENEKLKAHLQENHELKKHG